MLHIKTDFDKVGSVKGLGYDVPWAKTDGAMGNRHPLAHHCADVAACFETIANLPTIRSRMESVAGRTLSSVVLARLTVLVFLHDVGKLHPGFQAKGWPDGIWHGSRHGHVLEGAAIFCEEDLEPIALNLCKAELVEWGVDLNLLFSVLAHHGRPFRREGNAAKRWNAVTSSGLCYDPVPASQEIGQLVRRWFAPAFSASKQELPLTAQFQHLFCGLVSLADWLGSDPNFFPFAPELDSEYIARARQQGLRAVTAIGLDVAPLKAFVAGRTDFTSATGLEAPNAQQRLIDNFPIEEQLLVLEAETGSGKTEAAFWRFARLMEAGLVDSLYFALPTRAAAVQLHGRINKMLKHLFGELAPEAVLAVPGYLRSGEATGQALPDWNFRWDDEGRVAEDVLAARWAAENTKRYLAATVAVGTVDQAMLSALCVKHAHLRSASLSRSLLIIDEVHASDSYMTEIQSHLLKVHLNRGGHAMLMSATLGSRARAKFLGTDLPSFKESIAAPYPVAWSQNTPRVASAEPSGQQKAVSMTLLLSMVPKTAAELAIDAARRGARVLVIRNTVGAAIETWTTVQEAGGTDLLLALRDGPALHHGRFASEDRKLLDLAVEKALLARDRLPGGVIVIGTQTLEQSLDIDADLLITDLCPVDVLLQRIGRLHRQVKLTRPNSFEKPVCYVLAPERGLEPLLKPDFENGLGAWKRNGVLNGIYKDLAMLELTQRLIVEHSTWQVPAMNRMLVESATHPERIEWLHRELGAEWRKYSNDVVGGEIASRGMARNVLLPFQTPFADVLFPEGEEKIRTRLGEEGARITFIEPVEGPFGQAVTGLTLPAHWSHGLDTSESVRPLIERGLLSVTVGDHTFSYDRRGIMKTKQ